MKLYGKRAQGNEADTEFLFPKPANETFLDVKKILARWLWEMLTKKRLPERWEIFCCCLPCLLHFSVVVAFCANIILCVGKFTSGRLAGWVKQSERQQGRHLYLLCIILPSKGERGPEKASLVFRVFLSASRLKSHFRFVVPALRYIVTAASDIYFCKHSHNVVAGSFVNLFARCPSIFVDLQPEEMWQQKEQNLRRFINYRNDHTMTAAFCAIERKFLSSIHRSIKSTNFDVTFHSWLFKFSIILDKYFINLNRQSLGVDWDLKKDDFGVDLKVKYLENQLYDVL